jgi:hypothetical protein
VEKVIFEKEVLDYFDDLVFALFKEEYFGFPESAQNYVDKIVVLLFQIFRVFLTIKQQNYSNI